MCSKRTKRPIRVYARPGNSLLCSHEEAAGALLINESADLSVPSLDTLNILFSINALTRVMPADR